MLIIIIQNDMGGWAYMENTLANNPQQYFVSKYRNMIDFKKNIYV